MKTAQKLKSRYETALNLNNRLMAEVANNGGGAVGITATFAINTSKDLAAAQRKVRNALVNGDISTEEYKSILG